MLTTYLFNIFLPIGDWEIKPYHEYKGKGLLEQTVNGADDLPFNIKGWPHKICIWNGKYYPIEFFELLNKMVSGGRVD